MSSEFIYLKRAYRVVVLPEPVGPDVKTIPFGDETKYLIFFKSSSEAPFISILSAFACFESSCGARTRITIFSLPATGSVFTRKS